MIPDALAHLDLQPHPEGGFFRETHRSDRLTTIDYLLLPGMFSGWHRVRSSDEVWNHAAGGRVVVHLLSAAGYRHVSLGDTHFSVVVPAGCWQAAEAIDPAWVLAGCTVAPPFDFDDFEMAGPELAMQYPEHRAVVSRLLRA